MKLIITYILTILTYLVGVVLTINFFVTAFSPLSLFALTISFGILILGPRLLFVGFNQLIDRETIQY